MVHGDNEGLKLPPHIAPTQVVVCPIMMNKPGVLDKANELADRLKAAGIRVKVDDRDKTPGFKFADSEMRGIPVRLEIGPRDIENGEAVLVRRDNHEKVVVKIDELEKSVADLLEDIQKSMFEKAKAHLESHTFRAVTIDEMEKILDENTGFVKAMWCGCRECEDAIKEKTGATSRCMPFDQEHIADTCINCGKPAAKMVYWGRAY